MHAQDDDDDIKGFRGGMRKTLLALSSFFSSLGLFCEVRSAVAFGLFGVGAGRHIPLCAHHAPRARLPLAHSLSRTG